MGLIVKTISVLWHHRLVLMLAGVVLCMLLLFVGRRMYWKASLERVFGLQAELNVELSAYRGATELPTLLDVVHPGDADRVRTFARAGGQLSLTPPLCRRGRAPSVIGPQPEMPVCPVPAIQTRPSDIVCESDIRSEIAFEGGIEPRLEQACLVSIWVSKQGNWSLKSVVLGQTKDGPLFNGPSSLNEDAYPQMTER